MVNLDEFYMQACLDEAWKYQGLTYPNPAVGAAVLIEGRLLSLAAHQRAGAPHAEVLAIKEAYYRLTKDRDILPITQSLHLHNYLQTHAKELFTKATLYVTLEPCFHYGKTPPCSLLIKNLGFKKVVIGTPDPNPKAGGGARYLKEQGVDVRIGVLEPQCKELIEPFVKWSMGSFVLFKYAQTINGVIDGGIISSQASREYVHALRDRIDLLVIGGNTVRIDRPILDARLVGGGAPDILIYSKKKRFNEKIPLFGIEGRSVYIEDSLDRIAEHSFVMIEGGEGMMRATKRVVDWYLQFVAPKCRAMENYKFDKKMEFLHTRKIDRDLMIWSRNG